MSHPAHDAQTQREAAAADWCAVKAKGTNAFLFLLSVGLSFMTKLSLGYPGLRLYFTILPSFHPVSIPNSNW